MASARISEIEWRLTRIPFRTGYSPPSYRKAEDFLIKKSSGIRSVKKMRFVRLFHSRFNMANKFLARQIKWRGDNMGLLLREHVDLPGIPEIHERRTDVIAPDGDRPLIFT